MTDAIEYECLRCGLRVDHDGEKECPKCGGELRNVATPRE
ncbi:rubrerythrin-like domain-containing protein [Haloarchaeobius sp. DFWS5]